MADLAELAGLREKRLGVAAIARLVIVAGPLAHRVAFDTRDLRVLLVREPRRIAFGQRCFDHAR